MVGKKTVEEAIKIHYEDAKVTEPAEEEVTPANDTPVQVAETPSQMTPQPVVHENGDIVLDFSDDFDTPEPSNNPSTGFGGFAGWMRGRR